MTNKTPKAIFLDRDGTLIRDKNYLFKPSDIEYFPDTWEALKLMQTKGYQLYIITNQSGVGRGFFSMDDVLAVHRAIDEDIKRAGLVPFAGWGVCPHAPEEGCPCRKPEPLLIQNFIKRDGLETSSSWMVGDKRIDAECGQRAGINGALVRTSQGADQFKFFTTLGEFAQSLS